MPQISEISSSMVPGAESPETSLQVSSTSPEICDEPSRSKALSVRKIGKPAVPVVPHYHHQVSNGVVPPGMHLIGD
jgi:hypothetical protein